MKKFSIRKYVEWLTLIPLLIMAVSLETFFLHDRSAALDADLIDHGNLIVRQLAASSEYGVFSSNAQFLQNIAQSTLQQQDVQGVIIMDASSKSLIQTGKFSDAVEYGTIAASAAGANKAKELVGPHTPVLNNDEGLWLYQPIIPEQVELEDLGGKPATARQIGGVIIKMSRARTEHFKSQMIRATISVTSLFLMLAFFLVWRASRRITAPVRELSDAAQKIGAGNLDTRVSVSSHITELSILAHGINDMVAQLQQENAILHQRAEEATRLAAIAFESHEGMMVTDAKGVILRVNSAFTRITGYTDKEAVGKTTRLFKSGRHDVDFYVAMWESLNYTGTWQGEIWNRRKNGETYPAWLTITEVDTGDGKTIYYVANYTDITSRKAAENEIKNMAYYDALTLLPNRRMLIDRLNQAMATSSRSRHYGAVMFLDLDNFKPLNDKHGHAVGDLLLVEVARRITSCVREMDTVARFGGDEFVVMLEELDADKATSILQASLVAEKIRTILSQPYILTNMKESQVTTDIVHQCTSSIGVQLFAGHEISADDILKQTDLAMYQAKRVGRNSVHFCEEN